MDLSLSPAKAEQGPARWWQGTDKGSGTGVAGASAAWEDTAVPRKEEEAHRSVTALVRGGTAEEITVSRRDAPQTGRQAQS